MKTNHFLSSAAIFATALTLSCIIGCPQVAPKEDRTYSEVVNVPGVSKDDLYSRASLWFTDAFRGPEPQLAVPMNIPKKSAITASDRYTGTIKANYTFLTDELDAYGVFQIWLIYSNVELQVSDGQYRLTFSDPINGAATYNKQTSNWIYSSTEQLFTKYVLATKNVWRDLASSLRETVGGFPAGDQAYPPQQQAYPPQQQAYPQQQYQQYPPPPQAYPQQQYQQYPPPPQAYPQQQQAYPQQAYPPQYQQQQAYPPQQQAYPQQQYQQPMSGSATPVASSLIDSRDNKMYRVVRIGNQTWMAENLNYNVSGSKCYDNKENNCQKYGRLYNWNTATKICPSGWHLPSYADWEIFMATVGGEKTAGKFLKAASWHDEDNGQDKYGFAALPGGWFDSADSFFGIGDLGSWWSSTESTSDASRGLFRYISIADLKAVGKGNGNKSGFHLSVRCLQNGN